MKKTKSSKKIVLKITMSMTKAKRSERKRKSGDLLYSRSLVAAEGGNKVGGDSKGCGSLKKRVLGEVGVKVGVREWKLLREVEKV